MALQTKRPIGFLIGGEEMDSKKKPSKAARSSRLKLLEETLADLLAGAVRFVPDCSPKKYTTNVNYSMMVVDCEKDSAQEALAMGTALQSKGQASAEIICERNGACPNAHLLGVTNGYSMKLASTALASVVLSLTPAAARAADAPAPAETTAPAAAKLQVQVLGRVKNPGAFRLDAGTRLSDALIAAGAEFDTLVALGPGPLARDTYCMLGGPSLQYVFLTRTTETSKNISYMIDVSIMLRQHDLRYDPLLRDADKIFVPECRPRAKFVPTPPTFPKSEG